MIIRIIKSLFNLFIDEEMEYVEKQIRKYYDLFNSGKYPLNRKQCEAVVKNKRYNQVIAAAGTGKTTVLAYRIKYLIEEGIAPERIIAITYTKKAADEMGKRLREQFNIKKVEVRTIHSFANKILREELKQGLSVITPDEFQKFIGKEITRLIRSDGIFQDYYFRFVRYESGYLNRNTFNDKDELIREIINKKDRIINEFVNFIDLAKKNNIGPERIRKMLNKNNQRQYYFGLCAGKLYENLQSYLNKTHKIDFNDMIYKAVNILRENSDRYFERYDHMLVDEFQDVSLGQIEFIKQFFSEGSNMKLFCVGDDWQSIYSFQGSEPKYFIEFERYFGRTAKSYLTVNYRCPGVIIEAGNALISNNKDQIEKNVVANNKDKSMPVLHILSNGLKYDEYLVRYTLRLVKRLLRDGCKPLDIMVLCRYDSAVPYLNKVKKLLKKEQIPYIGKGSDYYNPDNKFKKPENAVSVFSIHQSKGREADNVILLHAVAGGSYSFPEPERETELIEPVKINKVDHLEEERRLFYVAITRTGRNLHILTQSNNISPFIKEIKPYLRIKKVADNLISIGDYVSFSAKVNNLWEDHSVKIKQVGLLRDRGGNVIKFLSWKNSKAPEIKENIWYKFSKVKVSRFNNKQQFVLTDITEVIPINEEIMD